MVNPGDAAGMFRILFLGGRIRDSQNVVPTLMEELEWVHSGGGVG